MSQQIGARGSPFRDVSKAWNLLPLGPEGVDGRFSKAPYAQPDSIPSTSPAVEGDVGRVLRVGKSTGSISTNLRGLPVVPLSAANGGVLTVADVAALLKLSFR